MEATPARIREHASRISAVLRKTCNASNPFPLARFFEDGSVALAPSCPAAVSREITTDLGDSQTALMLPIPDVNQPRFWFAMREQWKWQTKKRLVFIACGLRIYFGVRDEAALQFLRLEWVAPQVDRDGTKSYVGIHAGHPHWHIDRSALVGHEDYLRSLDILTTPSSSSEPEQFDPTAPASTQLRGLLDYSWIQNMHLPAQAGWMHPPSWDGSTLPGPHQCEPETIEELEHWWTGALSYLLAELPKG